MSIDRVDGKGAWEALQSAKDAVLIDVRTVEEFSGGHPQGAVNIPIMFRNPASGQMLPNPDFDRVVSQHYPKDTRIFVSCRSGQRSFMAAMRLEALGYTKLFNVDGGFGGSATAPGWEELGLPVSREGGPSVSYCSLADRK